MLTPNKRKDIYRINIDNHKVQNHTPNAVSTGRSSMTVGVNKYSKHQTLTTSSSINGAQLLMKKESQKDDVML